MMSREVEMSFEFTSRLQNFIDAKIGLKRDELRLEVYQPRWKRLFSDEAYLIHDRLRDESLRLYHCGSTSVPGLDAKPIIDIVGSAASLDAVDRRRDTLERIGYEYKGEYGIPGRRFCVLYNPVKTTAYVHLHLFQHGDSEIEKHLRFRDHLRSSSTARDTYLKHKRQLIDEARVERHRYSEMKSDVIANILSEAIRPSSPSRVLAVLGAAKGHSKTETFLREVYSDSSLELIDLNAADISAYSYSRTSPDAFQKIIRNALAADIVALATPVYWYAMSGAMKNFIDRFSDLMSGESQSLGEALYGKRIHLVATGHELNLPLGFEVPISCTAMYFGMDYMGAIYRSSQEKTL